VARDLPTETLHEIADGVFVWLLPGGENGVANAGVIADADGLTVVDTLMVRSQWAPFAAAVAELDRPVRRCVLTHAHIDHVGGTRAFPAAAIYATPAASWALDQPMPLDAYKSFMAAFADEFDDLAEVGTRPTRWTGPPDSRSGSSCSPPPGTPPATCWCWSRTPTCASPATCASSA
jgi:cyclase